MKIARFSNAQKFKTRMQNTLREHTTVQHVNMLTKSK